MKYGTHEDTDLCLVGWFSADMPQNVQELKGRSVGYFVKFNFIRFAKRYVIPSCFDSYMHVGEILESLKNKKTEDKAQ